MSLGRVLERDWQQRCRCWLDTHRPSATYPYLVSVRGTSPAVPARREGRYFVLAALDLNEPVHGPESG